MKQVFFFKVENAKPKIQNRASFDLMLENFEGKEMQMTVERKKKKRSTSQNAYLFGVVYPIVLQGFRDAGFNEIKSSEDVHDVLKLRFLKRTSVSEHGETIERILSSATLTTSEFMDYIAEIQQWSAEFLNIYIPDPNEQMELL